MAVTWESDDRVPALDDLCRQLAQCDQQARELCQGLSLSQLCWRSRPKSWSIAENLIHLRITTEVFAPSAARAIREARERELFSGGPFPLRRRDRFFVWYVEPPPRIRLPAPRPLRPTLDESAAATALEDFLEAQHLMLEQIDAARGIDLYRARVISPIASYIRMSLLALFSVHTGHERRHLWQASQVRAALP